MGCIVITQASCGETTATVAVGPAREATTLAAASSASLTGTVGTAITELPSVITRDSDGNPVRGTVVTFILISGGGSLTGAVATSNAAGIARVSGWKLGTIPGENSVSATSGRIGQVIFRANAVAGPPVDLVKLAGDGQAAAPGAAVAIRPRVRVSDIYGNGIRGVTVGFSVVTGLGSVSGETVVSDSIGMAELGSWTLGSLGTQQLVARSGGLPSRFFSAMAVSNPPLACGPAAELPERSTKRSELSRLSCTSSDGRLLEVFSVVVAEGSAHLFTLSSTDFDTYLELRGGDQVLLASNNDRASTTNSEIKALLPPGSYLLVASSFIRDAVGTYNISFGKASPSLDTCEELFVARGVTTHREARPRECPNSPIEYAEHFRVYLKAGSRVAIEVEDLSYSDYTLSLITPSGERVTGVDPRPYIDSLTYTAAVDGFYTIVVAATDIGAEYKLSVQ